MDQKKVYTEIKAFSEKLLQNKEESKKFKDTLSPILTDFNAGKNITDACKHMVIHHPELNKIHAHSGGHNDEDFIIIIIIIILLLIPLSAK